MGSIKDYGRFRPRLRTGGGWQREGAGRLGRRLIWQCAASVLMLLLVAAGVGADNWLGQSARYVVVSGLAEDSTWLGRDSSQQVLADKQPAAPAAAPAADAEAPPEFTAPASGVVVTDVTADSEGYSLQRGILIQGAAGQNVKAAAAGTVAYLGADEEGYVVELSHGGGFTSVYQGLSDISIGSGQQVTLGQALGVTDSGELTFSLLLEGAEVDPLEYLFQ